MEKPINPGFPEGSPEDRKYRVEYRKWRDSVANGEARQAIRECSKKTGLPEAKIREMQINGWSVSEILAGSPIVKKGILLGWNPKELIRVEKDYE